MPPDERLARIAARIRDIPDFPKPGILFKDICPVLADGATFALVIDCFVERAEALGRVDKVVGIDARGFIFAAAMADRLGCGFVPLRKKGKLPYDTYSRAYELEYGLAEIEIHVDAFHPGENVLLVDDLLATGGTAVAAVELIGQTAATLTGILFLVELGFLEGRAKLPDSLVHSLITY